MSLGDVAVRSMASLSADDVSALVQAATDAAKAASDAVTALREAQASRASGGGFQEASKVVRRPEPLGMTCRNGRTSMSTSRPGFTMGIQSSSWTCTELKLHMLTLPLPMLMERRRTSRIDVHSSTVSSQDC